MAYKVTEWEYSDVMEEEKEKKYVQEGVRNLLITDASYDPEDKEYKLTFTDVDDEGVEFSLRYWMETTDRDTGNIIPNKYTRSTLISLGKALFDKESKGCPAPCDVIGGVVRAEVKYKASNNGKEYPRIYKFTPASTAVVALASQLESQYSVDE